MHLPGTMSRQFDGGGDAASGYQSFAGTGLAAHQSNYGFDAQLPLGNAQTDGAPTTFLQFSHLTSLNSQSIAGPGADTLPYLYNQRDNLGDDWLELDHHFHNGQLSFKYDLWTESLTTNYVQGQVVRPKPCRSAVPSARSRRRLASPRRRSEAAPSCRKPHPRPFNRLASRKYSAPRFCATTAIRRATFITRSPRLSHQRFSTFGTSFDPRAGIVWTPTGNTAVRASVGTTFQTPQLSELVVPSGGCPRSDRRRNLHRQSQPADRIMPRTTTSAWSKSSETTDIRCTSRWISIKRIFARRRVELNVVPIPHCQTKRNPTPCPIAMPVNAGNGIYRGVEHARGPAARRDAHVRAGWDVDSSFLTVIPSRFKTERSPRANRSLGQPLHKAYLARRRRPAARLAYGAELDYEGWYNELNRSPYATLDAHVAYRHGGYEYGLYGTNLTNVYANRSPSWEAAFRLRRASGRSGHPIPMRTCCKARR